MLMKMSWIFWKLLQQNLQKRIFDPKLLIIVQCDASSEALDFCILQNGHPIAQKHSRDRHKKERN